MFNGTCGCTTTENEGALRLDTEDLAFDSAPTKIIAIERHWLHGRWEEFYPMGNLLTSTSLRGRRCKPVEAPERPFQSRFSKCLWLARGVHWLGKSGGSSDD